MSFGTHVRKVRNPVLPYQRRVQALRSCVQLYRPIGFQATLSVMQEIAGPITRRSGLSYVRSTLWSQAVTGGRQTFGSTPNSVGEPSSAASAAPPQRPEPLHRP